MIEKGDDPDSMGQGNNFENQSTQAVDDLWLIPEDGEDILNNFMMLHCLIATVDEFIIFFTESPPSPARAGPSP